MVEMEIRYPPMHGVSLEVCEPEPGWYDRAMPKSTKPSARPGPSGAKDAATGNDLFRVMVEAGGRVALPDAVLEQLGVAAGDYLVLEPREDGSAVVVSVSQVVDQAMGSMSDASPGRSLTDELTAEGRGEAREAKHNQVGVRELRQSLSRYLHRVCAGECFEVTERNLPVAILAPLPGRSSAFQRLAASGRVVPASHDLLELGPPPDRPHELAISEALAEQREERLR